MDLEDDAERLLNQLDVLRQPSDLDLLIFFARHPRALLASEQVATFLGYGVKEIGASLDRLVEAGFVTRTPNSKHAARMYVFAIVPPGGGWLPALRQMASTREGRLALMSALRRRSSDATNGLNQRGEREQGAVSAPLPFPKERTSAEDARRRSHVVAKGGSRQPSEPGGRVGER